MKNLKEEFKVLLHKDSSDPKVALARVEVKVTGRKWRSDKVVLMLHQVQGIRKELDWKPSHLLE